VELPSNDEDAGDVHEDPEAYRQSLILRLKGLQAREKVYLEEFGTDLPDLTEIPERLPRVYGEAIRKAKESRPWLCNTWTSVTLQCKRLPTTSRYVLN
jgi:hypothetical protein